MGRRVEGWGAAAPVGCAVERLRAGDGRIRARFLTKCGSPRRSQQSAGSVANLPWPPHIRCTAGVLALRNAPMLSRFWHADPTALGLSRHRSERRLETSDAAEFVD